MKTETHYGNFIGSSSCIDCHQKEYDNWEGSHHDLAMKIADSSTVLGDFNDAEFIHKGITTRFFKKGKDYMVNTEGPDGEYHDYKVDYTFGVEPLQQYLVKFPKGQYQVLLTAWDSNKDKWFALQEELDIRHNEWMHWSRGAMRWNNMCADCHSTNLQKNFDPETEIYNTKYSEINVSCEACHGPASEHVNYYKNGEQSSDPPSLYMETDMSSKEVVDKCARCHSRRSQLTDYFDYQGHFVDHYDPELLVYPTYERDGQIKDEDYVYGSFVQSKMYHSGVSCTDCHDPHTTKTRKTGNDLCLSCHEKSYDEPSHHFHEEGTDASLCVNCHMTGKIYMGNDFRRDHSFRIPRPDQTVKYGTPNACNSCHEDKSAEWASQVIVDQYGEERAEHFSDYLIPGQLGDHSALKKLISDPDFPAIVRATAIRQFVNTPLSPQDLELLQSQRKDSSALVRNEVVRALTNFSNPELGTYINNLLNDTVRLVRMNAARYFTLQNKTAQNEEAFQKAKNEYLDYLNMNSDFPSGQHQLGTYYEATGEIQKALNAYKKAIEIDDHYNFSRMNLALLFYKQGKVAEAEKLYLKVIEQEPQFAESYYMLGLLYNETNNTEKAMEYLSKACGLETPLMRACYNYALILQQNGQHLESVSVLEKALKSFPMDENLLYVKLLGEIKSGHNNAAVNTIEKLLQIAPQNSRYQDISRQLKQGNISPVRN
ncbi:tetratricopeptide repeat protein [Gramella sp. KN1008]|uniref:tetratricopeptide repeat protein n=1 Tax=Gramella sp. KN1008 TaxID=2529298 RepID=UPI0013F1537F|nr:tetratricopeptide repeat protein [Gramella sp. KN1008]